MIRRLIPVLLAVLAPAAASAAPSLTLYTRDLGFVREDRVLEAGARGDTVTLAEVPERLDFASVRLVPEGGARVSRLAFRYDVATGDALIQNAKGRRVRVTSRGDRATEGVLVGTDGGYVVVRADDGTVTAVAVAALETVRLVDPPPALAVRPSLEAVVAGLRGRTGAELSYLTGGLSWTAEHTVVRRGESAATWSTRVTVDNQTGVTWENANVKLVAGEPRRVAPPVIPYAVRNQAKEMLAAAADGAEMSQEAFADYHLYTLARPATLRDREMQSLGMYDPREVKTAARYFYRSNDPRGVTAQVEIRNTDAAGLGMPLPAGRVRFYQADASGAVQFTGETTIGHTAERETLMLDVGTAFDLVAERRIVQNRRLSDREREISVEVSLRNRKSSGVTIVVQENLGGGEIEVLKSSLPPRRRDANTLEFDVPVAAGRAVTLGYTYRVRY